VKKAEQNALSRGELAGIIIGGSLVFIITLALSTLCYIKGGKKEVTADTRPNDLSGKVMA